MIRDREPILAGWQHGEVFLSLLFLGAVGYFSFDVLINHFEWVLVAAAVGAVGLGIAANREFD